MAILLREEALYARSRLYATDVDEAALARAATGVYPLEVMREYTQNYQRSDGACSFSEYYSVSPRGAAFDPALRKNVLFSRHNLATDESFHSFQLVLCRNVLMYFERPLQERALTVTWRSLAPNGLLGLGQRETVPGEPWAGRYAELDAVNKLYRRSGYWRGMAEFRVVTHASPLRSRIPGLRQWCGRLRGGPGARCGFAGFVLARWRMLQGLDAE